MLKFKKLSENSQKKQSEKLLNLLKQKVSNVVFTIVSL